MKQFSNCATGQTPPIEGKWWALNDHTNVEVPSPQLLARPTPCGRNKKLGHFRRDCCCCFEAVIVAGAVYLFQPRESETSAVHWPPSQPSLVSGRQLDAGGTSGAATT